MSQHILVPLDGSKRAESAIQVAATLVRATRGSLLLMRVYTLPMSHALYLTQPIVLRTDAVDDDYKLVESYLDKTY